MLKLYGNRAGWVLFDVGSHCIHLNHENFLIFYYNYKIVCPLSAADGKRPRVWSPARLRGRQFVQFISASYYCFLSHRINELKQSLGQDDGVKSASEIKLEKSLLKWLNNVSISQMLEWFDAVTLQQIKSPYASKRITSETTKRDELFLRKLGILK